MTKAEIVASMAEKAGITKGNAAKALEAFVACVTDALARGEKISMTGFGSFSVAERSERTGKNPQTGKDMKIAARKAPKFSPGQGLKDAVNGK